MEESIYECAKQAHAMCGTFGSGCVHEIDLKNVQHDLMSTYNSRNHQDNIRSQKQSMFVNVRQKKTAGT